MRTSLTKGDFWQPKLRTTSAMTRLSWAQLLVAWVPFARWRHRLGLDAGDCGPSPRAKPEAERLAAEVEWAAHRLPFQTKCLPRAMALSWMLRRKGIGHAVVIAVRPSQLRQRPDALHAWVEVEGEKILGDLPGPWTETMRIGD
jgi:aryl-alcohol dehydrogenase-like predicted oxidoreductase